MVLGKSPGKKSRIPFCSSLTDAIVKIYKTTICGTDLHILKGDVPQVTDGRILGHEGIGIIEEVGSAVTTFQKGDKVLISCISSCGKCTYCRKGMYSHCEQGGWILGHIIDDAQAEYVRIPFSATHTINSQEKDAVKEVFGLTENVGADVAVEAVGIPATFDLCTAVIAPGGRIANVGVHGKPVELHLETLWSKNITITTRLVDTVTTPMLMKTVLSNKLDGKKLITHHFALNDIMQAYDTFANAARENALKVILTSE